MGIVSKLRRIRVLLHSLYVEIFHNPIIVNGSVAIGYNGKPICSNWGDDINYWLFREICEQPIVMYSQSVLNRLFRRKHILGIGSIIGMCSSRRSIIWGSGFLDTSIRNINLPAEIRAVRGPLTRKKLIEMGIDCPEIYGDPAMLIKKIYNPKVKKRYQIGIIAQHRLIDQETARRIFGQSDQLHYIDIVNYGEWHTFIDEILSCNAIISSSLHGLIMSETYGVPSVWMELPTNDFDKRIKYYDFYQSIGKECKPLVISDSPDWNQVNQLIAEWKPGKIDLQPLIENAPFKMRLR